MSKEYKPLHSLLAKYWDKPLAKMPKKLQARVKPLFWKTTWDEADIKKRQDVIRDNDVLFDETQEFNTWHQLFLYAKNKSEDGLDDGVLHCIIEDAKNNGNADVACILKDQIAKPLAELLDDKISPFPHWPNTDPLLWRNLYRFSRTLPAMRDAAKKDKDYAVVIALDDVSANLEHILDIDRNRVGDEVKAAYEAEKTQQAAIDHDRVGDEVVAAYKAEKTQQAAPDAAKDANSKAHDEPPGKLPRTEAGQLTIEAAWEIECETGEKTTSGIVMARLQMWANAKPNNHPALIKSIPHGVAWVTKKDRKEKKYMIEHCGNHLAKWYKRRI